MLGFTNYRSKRINPVRLETMLVLKNTGHCCAKDPYRDWGNHDTVMPEPSGS